MSKEKIALVGNPNVGKSTVFNNLTGMHQHTGNWTGKTVDLANFPHDEFYELLQERIKNSKVDKSGICHKVADAEGSY